ncbi:hypothetical protein E3N88_10817 [Mikania micrantha]|uniref:TF-B3 domain-containing protein n=1 Tax=Mikania micrantha TaxID=192012 RepID=A0A5N6PEK3_9ASTR|nr:hypothetical protein E3N88_10817 [Mikania micrantha]
MKPNIPCTRVYMNPKDIIDNTEILFGSYLEIPCHTKILELPKEYGQCMFEYNYPTGDVFLRTDKSKKFKVLVTLEEDGFVINSGWFDFVNHLQLKESHVVLFRYDGDSTFTILTTCQNHHNPTVPGFHKFLDEKNIKDDKMCIDPTFVDHHMRYAAYHAKIEITVDKNVFYLNLNHIDDDYFLTDDDLVMKRVFGIPHIPTLVESDEEKSTTDESDEGVVLIKIVGEKFEIPSHWVEYAELDVSNGLTFKNAAGIEWNLHMTTNICRGRQRYYVRGWGSSPDATPPHA